MAVPLSLDLFAIAAADEPAVAPAPVVQEVLTFLGPVTPNMIRVLPAELYGHTTYEFAVTMDPRACPFCNKPVGDKPAIAIMENGDWRWADIDCAVFAKKGQSDMVPGAPWRQRQWPPCTKCGLERSQHVYAEGKRWCDDDECSIEYAASGEVANAA